MKMFKFFILILFSNLTILSNAQFVTIPDAGFVSYLQYTYPSCMSGNMMDTTCNEIVNETELSIPSSYNIFNISGVQYFDNLDTLDLYNHPVTSIPFLPMDLEILNLAYTDVNSIANFPSTVISIEITSTNVSSIPTLPAGLISYFRSATPNLPAETTLPITLETYYIRQSNVVDLAPLPSGLKRLSIGSNYFINMPSFPNGLEALGIGNLNLTELPPLPNSLLYLVASQNSFTSLTSFPPNLEQLNLPWCASLTTIENLPSTLEQFGAQNCNLSSIDFLPNSIFNLDLKNNDLTTLPNIPTSATVIRLADNNLTSLPSLPTPLYTLELENNSLYCLPNLPSTIQTISLDNNNFTCLPNILPAMSSVFQSYPLCVDNDPVDNPFGCIGAEGIEGHTFMDTDANCVMDASDVGIINVPVKVFDNLGNVISLASTFTDGRYFFGVGTGDYDVTVLTSGRPYEEDCVNPGLDSTVTVTAGNPLVSDVNFGLKCKDGFDVGTRSVGTLGFIFPGQPHTLVVKSGDMTDFYNMNCSDGISGTVTVTVNGPVTFQGVTPGSLTPSIAGNVYTYSIADFGMVDSDVDFRLDFETDTTAQAGDLVCVDVVVTPNSGDFNPINNNYSTCIEVVNSYDPNNKLVYPTTISPDFDDYLTYTINFQNTGNAPAFNIRLEDTLSADLDLSTFEIIDYSHDMHYRLDNNKLTVYFPNIMLIDSTSSEPDSKGYVKYRIKTNGGLVDGDQIDNTAFIFFDFNDPIVTNTAITEVNAGQVGVKSISKQTVQVYPNPSNGEFNLSVDEKIVDLKVFDQLGQQVNIEFDSSINKLGLSNQKAGLYFLKIEFDNSVVTKRILKR